MLTDWESYRVCNSYRECSTSISCIVKNHSNSVSVFRCVSRCFKDVSTANGKNYKAKENYGSNSSEVIFLKCGKSIRDKLKFASY